MPTWPGQPPNCIVLNYQHLYAMYVYLLNLKFKLLTQTQLGHRSTVKCINIMKYLGIYY